MVDYTALTAQFARREKSANMPDSRTRFARNVCQDAEKVAMPKIRHLAPPQPLHAPQLQIFKEDTVIRCAEIAGKVPVPGCSLVSNPPMDTSQVHTSPGMIRRTFHLARKAPICRFQPFKRRLERLWRLSSCAIAARQECLESKVESCVSTRHGPTGRLYCNDAAQQHEQITDSIPFDRHRFDIAIDCTGFTELVDRIANPKPVVADQSPTGLFQGERLGLPHFSEAWRPCILFAEELLIAKFNALSHVLDGLRTQDFPVLVALPAFAFRKLFLQARQGEVCAKASVVAPMQRDADIVDVATNANLAMQVPVACMPIEFVGIGPSGHLHALLMFNGALNDFQRDRADRAHAFRSGPQARQAAFQARKLLAEHMCCIALDLADNLHDAILRVHIQQQMHMVRHDCHLKHSIPIGILLCKNEFFKSVLNRLREDWTPILRAPDDMVLAAIDD